MSFFVIQIVFYNIPEMKAPDFFYNSIGYLSQEPELEFETVQECIDDAVQSSRAIIDKYNEESMKLADPDITDEEMTAVMEEMEKINDQIEAGNLWELDRG